MYLTEQIYLIILNCTFTKHLKYGRETNKYQRCEIAVLLTIMFNNKIKFQFKFKIFKFYNTLKEIEKYRLGRFFLPRRENLKRGKKSEFPMLRPLVKAPGPFLEGGRVTYEISTSIISARNPFTGQPQPGTRHYNALLAELARNLTAL